MFSKNKSKKNTTTKVTSLDKTELKNIIGGNTTTFVANTGESASNVLKTRHDTVKNSINNIR